MKVINELKAMAIFAEVVKQGSFKKAANILGLSPSVISYHISQLEQKTDCALLYRSTRKLTLSHDGEVFYQHVLQMLSSAQQGIELLANNQQEPKGSLTISLPTALSTSLFTEKIAEFALASPKVSLNLDYCDKRSDIIEQGVDIAIRAGTIEDSDFKSIKLGYLRRVLVCSPSFYQKHLPPKSLDDLAHWTWLKLAQLPNTRLFKKGSTLSKITFNHQLTVNSVEAIHQYCCHGVGLAVLAESQVNKQLESGELINVLTDWQVEPLPLFALWPKNVTENSITKLLVNHLKLVLKAR